MLAGFQNVQFLQFLDEVFQVLDGEHLHEIEIQAVIASVKRGGETPSFSIVQLSSYWTELATVWSLDSVSLLAFSSL